MKIIYDSINNYSKVEYDHFFSLIKSEKQKKINKLANSKDKKRSILGEMLFIKILEEFKIDYYSIEIYKNEYGKPLIKDLNIYFNISHSKDYVVCVASKNQIGVDIEYIRKINNNVVYQFATTNEVAYINNNNKNFSQKCFEIFTLKEAYFKCIGTNLNGIKNIEFSIKKNSIQFNNKDFNFKLVYSIDNYVIAICEKINYR